MGGCGRDAGVPRLDGRAVGGYIVCATNFPEVTDLREVGAGPHGDIGTARILRLVPADDAAAKALKKRTLTNLYNERPTWLDFAHRTLDEAVDAALHLPGVPFSVRTC